MVCVVTYDSEGLTVCVVCQDNDDCYKRFSLNPFTKNIKEHLCIKYEYLNGKHRFYVLIVFTDNRGSKNPS